MAEPPLHTDPALNAPKDRGDSSSTPWQGNGSSRAELGWTVVLTNMLWISSHQQETAVFRVILQLLLLGDVLGTPSNPCGRTERRTRWFFPKSLCSREKLATSHFYQKNQCHASKWKKEVPFLLWWQFLKQTHADNGLKTSTFPGTGQATPTRCMCRLWWQRENKTRAEAPLNAALLIPRPRAQQACDEGNRAGSKLFCSSPQNCKA